MTKFNQNQDYNIRRNCKFHDKIVEKYEKLHGEIFNPIEQNRINEKIKSAINYIKTDSISKHALDFGCGTGNLTKYLIENGIITTSADISYKSLHYIRAQYSESYLSNCVQINGINLDCLKDNKFEMVATYSVLHHIDDYLSILKELIRVLKPGGILYIDHEVNPSYWKQSDVYKNLLLQMKPGRKRYLKLLSFHWYLQRIKLLANPRYQEEGDIHVFSDDHIEWIKINTLLTSLNCETVHEEDYLLYKRNYPVDIFNHYKDKCNDMRLLIVRKIQ